jgi:DNA-binding MarR family transcriptional regulator
MTTGNPKLRAVLDAESKVTESPVDHKDELRLWLRLLTCTTLIETEIRKRLRTRFNETLPRFDLMAQLERVRDGMTLGEVSKRMMVSAGNVTSLVDRLVKAGYLERRPAPNDRRSQLIQLTQAGRAHFNRLAANHEKWVAELLGDLDSKEMAAAMSELAKVKKSVRRAIGGLAAAEDGR